MKCDLAIIGGGPAGYTAAERAAENGLQTVMFEKNAVGVSALTKVAFRQKLCFFGKDFRQH